MTRERDLEGHLPAEGQAAPKGGTVFRQPGDAKNEKTPFPDTGPRTAAEVPVNPVGKPTTSRFRLHTKWCAEF